MDFKGVDKKMSEENILENDINELDTEENQLKYKEETKGIAYRDGKPTQKYSEWLKALPKEPESIIDKEHAFESYNEDGVIYIIVLGDDNEICIYNDLDYAVKRFDDILEEYPNAKVAKVEYTSSGEVEKAGKFDAAGVAWEEVYKLQRKSRRKKED